MYIYSIHIVSANANAPTWRKKMLFFFQICCFVLTICFGNIVIIVRIITYGECTEFFLHI